MRSVTLLAYKAMDGLFEEVVLNVTNFAWHFQQFKILTRVCVCAHARAQTWYLIAFKF